MLPIKIAAKVNVAIPDIKKLSKLSKLSEVTDARLEILTTAWGAIYRAAMKHRFIKESKGGGEWPPLAFMRERNYQQAKKVSQKILNTGLKNKKIKASEKALASMVLKAHLKTNKPYTARNK